MNFAIVWKLLNKLEEEHTVKLRLPAVHASLYLFQEALHVPLNYQFCVPGTEGLPVEAYTEHDMFGTTLDIYTQLGPFNWFVYEPNKKGVYILANDSKRFVKKWKSCIQEADIYSKLIDLVASVTIEIGADNLPFFALCYYTLRNRSNVEHLRINTPSGLSQKEKGQIIYIADEWINKYI